MSHACRDEDIFEAIGVQVGHADPGLLRGRELLGRRRSAVLLLEHAGGSQISAIQTGPIFVRAGQRRVSAAFVDIIDGPYEDQFSPAGWSSAGEAREGPGITALTHIEELLVTGPKNVRGVSETPARQRVLTCRPRSQAEEPACARTILSALAAKATEFAEVVKTTIGRRASKRTGTAIPADSVESRRRGSAHAHAALRAKRAAQKAEAGA